MGKIIAIPDVGNIEFPDSMSDADIAKAAKTAHEGAQFDKKAADMSIKPEDTFMPGANKWLKENHPKIYSAIEGLMTAIPRGEEQISRGVLRPGLTPAQRGADVLEGAMTGASPALLAVPGAGPRAMLNAGTAIGTGALSQQLGSGVAGAFGAAPDTQRLVGDVAGIVGGGAAAAGELGPRVVEGLPRASAAVGDVLLSPGVIKGLKRSTEGVVVGSAMHGNLPGVGLGVAGRIGAGMLENAAERRAAAKLPPAAASIVEKAQSAPPLTPAEQSLAEHIMANVEPEVAAPPAAGPASIPLQGPADMPAPRAGQVGQAAMPATPAAALQMPGPQGAPVPASPAEAVSQAPQVQVIPSPEPAVPQAVYKAKAQAAKATKVAQYLHENGITASQIEQMLQESDPAAVTAFMDDAAKRAGQKALSPDESVPMMVEKLKSLEKPSAAAEVPEALRKNPAAMKAAMDLAAEQSK